eukprot:366196-Chlamydomonas_euryale.AAC.21
MSWQGRHNMSARASWTLHHHRPSCWIQGPKGFPFRSGKCRTQQPWLPDCPMCFSSPAACCRLLSANACLQHAHHATRKQPFADALLVTCTPCDRDEQPFADTSLATCTPCNKDRQPFTDAPLATCT